MAWTLLRIRIKALERRLEDSARAEAESEARIRELVGLTVEERAVNGGHRKRERRRHLWLVPVVAALASVAGLVRHHPHQVWAGAAAAVSAAVLTLMMVSGAGGSSRAQPPEPVPIIARTPSQVMPLPSSVSSPVRQPSSTPGGGTPIGSVAATQGMLPPPATVPATTVSSAPPLPTSTTLAPPVPTTTTGCLLGVSLDPLLGLCVG